MKLKKFDELNEEIGPPSGEDFLSEEMKKDVSRLVKDLKEVTSEYLNNAFNNKRFVNESNNEGKDNAWQVTIKMPLEDDFIDYVVGWIQEHAEEYNVAIGEKYGRGSELIFNGEVSIPLNMSMHGDNFIYDDSDKLQYSVWINTYVAQKI